MIIDQLSEPPTYHLFSLAWGACLLCIQGVYFGVCFNIGKWITEAIYER